MWVFHIVWILVLSVLSCLYWYMKSIYSFWSKQKNVRFIEPHWIFGSFGDWMKRKDTLHELSSNMYKDFKRERFVGYYSWLSPSLLVIDPELIRDILVKDHQTWWNRGITYNADADPLSQTLVNFNDERWKYVRAKLMPGFSPLKLKKMLELTLDSAKDFEKYSDAIAASGGLVEARDLGARFLTDANGSCALGIKMNSLNGENSLYPKLRALMFDPTLKEQIIIIIQLYFPGLFNFLRLSTISGEVTDIFLQMTKQSFDYHDNHNVHKDHFMDLLKKLKNTRDGEIEFDLKLLAAQAFDFVLSGFESGSAVISFCLHELAVNKEIQDRLRKEVHLTKTAHNGEITWDALHSMKYLDMVFQETLRKYPPDTDLLRTNVKPYRIPNTDVLLPVGSSSLIPVYGIHHDPEYYPHPDVFDPERFTDEAKKQRPGFTYLPFGDGPRNCIGLRLAELQAKVAILTLVDKFDISLDEKSQHPLQFDARFQFLYAKDGVWIRISRNSSN